MISALWGEFVMARRPSERSSGGGDSETGDNVLSDYRRISRFFIAVLVAFLAALAIRSFVAAPYSIPSESMEPNLLVGDYVIATKWDYGLRIGGRMLSVGAFPHRGDIIIFDSEAENDDDKKGHYVKRVIGLPGDRIALQDGDIWLNGAKIARHRRADFILPISANMDKSASGFYSACFSTEFEKISPSGERICRFRQYSETLPGGHAHHIIDLIDGLPYDQMSEVVVPQGRLFVMGDNRDRSADSRVPRSIPGAIGLVPLNRVSGRAAFIIFSVDGSAEIGKPGSWIDAIRWDRLFRGLR